MSIPVSHSTTIANASQSLEVSATRYPRIHRAFKTISLQDISDQLDILTPARGRIDKVNAELVTLTYGTIVAQLCSDLDQDYAEVNKQLDKMGYNIGMRLIEDFFAKSSAQRCANFRETAETISKVCAVTVFITIASVLCCNHPHGPQYFAFLWSASPGLGTCPLSRCDNATPWLHSQREATFNLTEVFAISKMLFTKHRAAGTHTMGMTGVRVRACKHFHTHQLHANMTDLRCLQVGFKIFLNITPAVDNWSADGKQFSLIFEENPLADFVELPDDNKAQDELWFSNLLCGVLRGCLEMVSL